LQDVEVVTNRDLEDLIDHVEMAPVDVKGFVYDGTMHHL
jgi:hypothetical protein